MGAHAPHNRRTSGFNLMEALVTVALITILGALVIIGVGRYRRSAKALELDGIAREVFVAAQNHLSVAEGVGEVERIQEQAQDNPSLLGIRSTRADEAESDVY